jgi:hypothetical protein
MRILREGGVRDLYAGFIPILFNYALRPSSPQRFYQSSAARLLHGQSYRNVKVF